MPGALPESELFQIDFRLTITGWMHNGVKTGSCRVKKASAAHDLGPTWSGKLLCSRESWCAAATFGWLLSSAPTSLPGWYPLRFRLVLPATG